MLEPILNAEQKELLESERTLLAEVAEALEQSDASKDDLKTLAESVAQLDELFLLIVVGEFNAGKSALINALLGREVLAEGVTPTTQRVHLLRYAEQAEQHDDDDQGKKQV